jgi:hypothetical protein
MIRTLIGTIIDPTGDMVNEGRVDFRPVGEMPIDEGLLLPIRGSVTISGGAISSPIVAGSLYEFEVFDGQGDPIPGMRFEAPVPATEPPEISFSDLYATANTSLPLGSTFQQAVTEAVEQAIEDLGIDSDGDGRVDRAELADSVPWAGVTGPPATFPPSVHSHPTSEILGLDATITGINDTLSSHDSRLTALESSGVGAASESGIIDIDELLEQNPGWTDGEAILWAIRRLRLTDNDLPTERNIVILLGEREYDITDLPFLETGVLGTYGTGETRYGASAQLLIPATGPIASNKVLTLEFRAKRPSSFGYSVVNGDASNVMPTNAVIRSDAIPPAGEGGNYTIIGGSRALDGYAGLYLTCVIIVTNNVTFRPSEGLSAGDWSHCFSWQGERAIADTGIPSDDLHLHDPRRNPDGSAYTGGAEIEFRKWSVGFKSPRIANGADCHVHNIDVQGFRIGLDHQEHLRVDYIFPNYNYEGIRLRAMSHVATIGHAVFQRCPIWLCGPDVGDNSGWGSFALIRVGLASGELYHPGEFGNPPGARWYNHVSRIWDPNDMIKGEITIYEHPGEEDPAWPTIPSGHGANLIIRHLGVDPIPDPPAPPDFSPATLNAPIDGDTITIIVNDLKPRYPTRSLLDSDAFFTWVGLVAGTVGSALFVGSTEGAETFTPTPVAPSGWILRWHGGAAPAIELGDDDLGVIFWEAIEGPIDDYLMLDYMALGNSLGASYEVPGIGSVIMREEMTGAAGSSLVTPHALAIGTGNWSGSSEFRRDASGTKVSYHVASPGILLFDVTQNSGGNERSRWRGDIVFLGNATNGFGLVVNHNNGVAWNEQTYWMTMVNEAGGTIILAYYNGPAGGTITQYGGTYSRGSAFTGTLTHEIRISADGDTVTVWLIDGATETQIISSGVVAGRPSKTGIFFGIRDGGAGANQAHLDNIETRIGL